MLYSPKLTSSVTSALLLHQSHWHNWWCLIKAGSRISLPFKVKFQNKSLNINVFEHEEFTTLFLSWFVSCQLIAHNLSIVYCNENKTVHIHSLYMYFYGPCNHLFPLVQLFSRPFHSILWCIKLYWKTVPRVCIFIYLL